MAMTTLLAMGILDSDDSLVAAALSEIQTMPIDKRVELDPERIVSQLLVKHYLAQVMPIITRGATIIDTLLVIGSG
jgi:superkiller protein 3